MNVFQLWKLPVGRVLKRENKTKTRICQPTKYVNCDLCNRIIIGKAVRVEKGSNIILMTQCFFCFLEEKGCE
jgi:RNase P subunit RPR2